MNYNENLMVYIQKPIVRHSIGAVISNENLVQANIIILSCVQCSMEQAFINCIGKFHTEGENFKVSK